MSGQAQADGAEQALADRIDDIVPSYGYRQVPVVGLGGSAGSIEALQSFFACMPPDSRSWSSSTSLPATKAC